MASCWVKMLDAWARRNTFSICYHVKGLIQQTTTGGRNTPFKFSFDKRFKIVYSVFKRLGTAHYFAESPYTQSGCLLINNWVLYDWVIHRLLHTSKIVVIGNVSEPHKRILGNYKRPFYSIGYGWFVLAHIRVQIG